MNKTYGYIRVSSRDQNPDRQYAAMEELQIPRKNIYLDKISGKDFARPSYLRLLRRMHKGDLLVVKSIDRLGRNYTEILEQWRKITKDIEADIQVIDMPLLNTNRMEKDLMGVFVSDLVLQILAYVAETERAFIHQRQAEGIALAKARGVQLGRKRLDLPEEFENIYSLWKQGELSGRKAAEYLGVSHATFYRRCQEMEKRV